MTCTGFAYNSKEEAKRLHSAADIEGHRGVDQNIFLLDFRWVALMPESRFPNTDVSRSMPPERPNKAFPSSQLYRLLRPELVTRFEKRLCPDAYSGFTLADPERKSYCDDIDVRLQFYTPSFLTHLSGSHDVPARCHHTSSETAISLASNGSFSETGPGVV